MTRKDYVLLASALHDAKPNDDEMRWLGPKCIAWMACVTSVAHRLAQDNPRFDAVKFLAASGNGAFVDFMYQTVKTAQERDAEDDTIRKLAQERDS